MTTLAIQEVSWDQWRQVAEQGHEIGSHSVYHPDLTTLSEADLRWELSESQITINQNIPSQSCVSFAYPSAECNDLVRAVTSEYYIAARAAWASEGGEFNYYEDGPSWQAVNFYNVGSQSIPEVNPSISDIDYNLNFAIQTHTWHCMHFSQILDTDFFAAVLDDLLSRNLWIDTFGSIVRYMRERMSSTLTVLSEGGTEIKLDLAHSLDSSIYNQPLTVRSTIPPSWHKVNVQQGDVSIPVDSTIEGLETVIYYNAVPNNGTITLTLSEGDPTLTSISVSPPSASVAVSGTQQFTATARDQFGNPMVPQPTFTWTVSGGGTISSSGLFTAASTPGGPYTVTAASGSVSGTASVTVTQTLTSISVSPPSASVAVSGSTAVYGDSPRSVGNPMVPQPTFTWTVSGGGTISSSGLFTAASAPGGP